MSKATEQLQKLTPESKNKVLELVASRLALDEMQRRAAAYRQQQNSTSPDKATKK